MTRDSKLALVIAITLILLVGVLLSDHFSGATAASFDTPVAAQPARPVGTPDDAIDRFAQRPEPAASSPVEMDAGGYEQPPVVIAQGARTSLLDDAFGRLRDAEAPALVGERDLSGDVARDMARGVADGMGNALERTGLFERVDGSQGTLPPRDQRRLDAPVKPMREPEARSSGNTPIATEWRTHTVVAGDSLYALARTYLGNGDRWQEIQANNAGKLGADGVTLSVGMTLRIDRVPARQPGLATTPRTSQGSSGRASERTYVVLPGDSLGTISQNLLGTARRMDEIVKLNGLSDPDDIKVGQTLRIPARDG